MQKMTLGDAQEILEIYRKYLYQKVQSSLTVDDCGKMEFYKRVYNMKGWNQLRDFASGFVAGHAAAKNETEVSPAQI